MSRNGSNPVRYPALSQERKLLANGMPVPAELRERAQRENRTRRMLARARRADGAWMQTMDGAPFDLIVPTPAAVDIRHVARVLSRLCRFAGHSRHFYSVAQHSVLVSRLVPVGAALEGLLHDAGEAYRGDITGPMQAAERFALGRWATHLEEMRARIDAAVAARFGLCWPPSPEVHYADAVALSTERRDVLAQSERPWLRNLPPPADEVIRPIGMGLAERLFLQRFQELTGEQVMPDDDADDHGHRAGG